jgi:ankyrin repeat protein
VRHIGAFLDRTSAFLPQLKLILVATTVLAISAVIAWQVVKQDHALGKRLYDAALDGSVEGVAHALRDGALPDAYRDVNKSSALIMASSGGHIPVIQRLLTAGADKEARSETTDGGGGTALLAAASAGHTAAVRLLLENGAKIEAANSRGFTPLMSACSAGRLEVSRLLLEAGANINAMTSRAFTETQETDKTSLMFAAEANYASVTSLLLDMGAEVEAKTYERHMTALLFASSNGSFTTGKVLLDAGADLQANASDLGWDAIIFAADKGHDFFVKLLIDRGADPNAQSKTGYTALMGACYQDHPSVVSQLLQAGAEPDQRGKDGMTALLQGSDSACETAEGRLEVMRLLLNAGANPNLKNIGNYTALMYAANCGHVDIVRLLLDNGVDVSAKNSPGDHTSGGHTALTWAAKSNHLAVVQLLLERDFQIQYRGVAELRSQQEAQEAEATAMDQAAQKKDQEEKEPDEQAEGSDLRWSHIDDSSTGIDDDRGTEPTADDLDRFEMDRKIDAAAAAVGASGMTVGFIEKLQEAITASGVDQAVAVAASDEAAALAMEQKSDAMDALVKLVEIGAPEHAVNDAIEQLKAAKAGATSATAHAAAIAAATAVAAATNAAAEAKKRAMYVEMDIKMNRRLDAAGAAAAAAAAAANVNSVSRNSGWRAGPVGGGDGTALMRRDGDDVSGSSSDEGVYDADEMSTMMIEAAFGHSQPQPQPQLQPQDNSFVDEDGTTATEPGAGEEPPLDIADPAYFDFDFDVGTFVDKVDPNVDANGDRTRMFDSFDFDVDKKRVVEGAMTALAWAASKGHVDVVRLLLEHIDVEHVQYNQQQHQQHGDAPAPTPVLQSARYTFTKDQVGSTTAAAVTAAFEAHSWTSVLLHAAQNAHAPVVQLLLEAGADANVQYESVGTSALMLAAATGDISVCKQLIHAGADPVASDNKGLTAADYAFGFADVESLLARAASKQEKHRNRP